MFDMQERQRSSNVWVEINFPETAHLIEDPQKVQCCVKQQPVSVFAVQPCKLELAYMCDLAETKKLWISHSE